MNSPDRRRLQEQTMTDATLLADAAGGSESAFRALVEPHRRALEIHCYRMLGSPHDAEEVVNDVLLRAWRHADRFDGRAAVRTWLYRIATNACLDELRRRKRQPDTLPQPYPDVLADQAAEPIFDPAARYARREGLELAFLAAIQQLPGRQRAVLILRDVLGWSAPEIAETLETSAVAVNSALQRARATIDAALPATTPSRPAQAQERALIDRYVQAWERDDVDGIVALLKEDAFLHMPPGPDVHGHDGARTFFLARRADGTIAQATLAPMRANGQEAILMRRGATPYKVLVLTIDDDAIARIDVFSDAGTLERFDRAQKRLRTLSETPPRR
jgi:RNA polymerase sigma-70 factor (ECF subfamily)